jgi:hypothetical protein
VTPASRNTCQFAVAVVAQEVVFDGRLRFVSFKTRMRRELGSHLIIILMKQHDKSTKSLRGARKLMGEAAHNTITSKMCASVVIRRRVLVARRISMGEDVISGITAGWRHPPSTSTKNDCSECGRDHIIRNENSSCSMDGERIRGYEGTGLQKSGGSTLLLVGNVYIIHMM